MGYWIAWIVGVVLLLMFLWIALANAVIFWEGAILKKRTASTAGLLGGILGMIGLLVLPWSTGKHGWWLPLFLDLGCVPWLTYQLLYFLFDALRKPKHE